MGNIIINEFKVEPETEIPIQENTPRRREINIQDVERLLRQKDEREKRIVTY